MAAYQVGDGRPDGITVGESSGKIGFYGVTSVVQPSGASQAAAASTTTTTATTTALQTDIDALRVLLNKLRADLVTLGLIAGA